jgi:hypothetical protein
MDENNQKERNKYLVQLDDGAADQICTYAELIDIISKQHEEHDGETFWKFKLIHAHQ